MNLSRKTFIYTFLISLIVTAFFAVYLIWLLPGLYVDHFNRAHIDDFQSQHLAFLDKGSYEAIEPFHSVTNLSFVLPKATNEIRLYSLLFDAAIQLQDEGLQALAAEWKQALRSFSPEPPNESVQVDLSRIFPELFQPAIDQLPMQIDVKRYSPVEYSPDDVNYVFRRVSDETNIMAVTGRFDTNEYMNLIAVTDRAEEFVVSWSSVVTGSIEQILPVTTQSLPMITLMVLAIVTLASYLFASRIVRPITRVSDHARRLMDADYQRMQPLRLRGGDEISRLAGDLDALYDRLRTQYRDLKQEHSRQEVVLRSSAHQLKTPITASLLLVDGMKNRVGKYADYDTTLPLVQEQLKGMQQMVESILALQAMQQSGESERIDLAEFFEGYLQTYRELAAQKGITIRLTGEKTVTTDPNVLDKIFDPVLSNAISYSEPGAQIVISLGETVEIENRPALIHARTLEHAMEPFVSSQQSPGRGLGLYLAKHCAALLSWEMSLLQDDDRVTIRLADRL